MIEGKWYPPGACPGDALKVRTAVFGSGQDELDKISWNVAVYEDGEPAAAGRIRWEEGAFLLSDISVIPERRGRMLGDLVLRLLLYKAESHAAREVRLTCPEDTAGFFERLGFETVSRNGSTKEMSLMGDRINLDRCAGCKKPDCPRRSV